MRAMIFAPVIAVAVFGVMGSAHGAVVTFESVAALTRFGTPTNVAGELVHTEAGIQMRVQTFLFTGSGSAFNFAEVRNASGVWPSKFLSVNNVNLEFGFASIGFPVTSVTIPYTDQGGFENLGVNGSALYRGELGAAPASLGGATVSVVPPVGGGQGLVTITGVIQSVTIGGQEFGIDNITAVPGPGAGVVMVGGGVMVMGRRRR
jgi:hypothetical protein